MSFGAPPVPATLGFSAESRSFYTASNPTPFIQRYRIIKSNLFNARSLNDQTWPKVKNAKKSRISGIQIPRVKKSRIPGIKIPRLKKSRIFRKFRKNLDGQETVKTKIFESRCRYSGFRDFWDFSI